MCPTTPLEELAQLAREHGRGIFLAGLSIILPDGTEGVVSGVVDEELIQAYDNTA
jgi:hypothetical protein